MKRKKSILIVILILIFIIAIAWQIIKTNLVEKANSIVLSDLELADINDGIYIGEYNLSPVKVIAEVHVKSHQIYKINILEHENGFGEKAEKITGDIIEKQDLDVDLVSGATVSSKVIIKAVDNALNK